MLWAVVYIPFPQERTTLPLRSITMAGTVMRLVLTLTTLSSSIWLAAAAEVF